LERGVRTALKRLTTFASGPLAAAWKSFIPPGLTRRSSEPAANPSTSTQGGMPTESRWRAQRSLRSGWAGQPPRESCRPHRLPSARRHERASTSRCRRPARQKRRTGMAASPASDQSARTTPEITQCMSSRLARNKRAAPRSGLSKRRGVADQRAQ
jgi:hypothetical protein